MKNIITKSLSFFSITGLLLGFLSAAACGESQSKECKKYIECQHYFDEFHDRARTELNKYQGDGVCWVNSSAASKCNETCDKKFKYLVQSISSNKDPLTDACKN